MRIFAVSALLHKNTRETDIAVMLFRTSTSYAYFSDLVQQMRERLVAEGVISRQFAAGRGFHYSKSPFEQLLDARGYLIEGRGTPVPLDETSFGRFLMDRGIPRGVIEGLLQNPIGCFETDGGSPTEDSIFSATHQMSFSTALNVFRQMTAQYFFGS